MTYQKTIDLQKGKAIWKKRKKSRKPMEIEDDLLEGVVGGIDLMATNPQRNLPNLTGNSLNVGNISNINGQQKYKINRLGGGISVTPPEQ